MKLLTFAFVVQFIISNQVVTSTLRTWAPLSGAKKSCVNG